MPEQASSPQSNRTATGPRRRAVVIGGSVAGSLAAAALSPHFDDVVVLDRDSFPGTPAQRKGVPQGHHFHALLAAGRQAIDKLLPGFSHEMLRLGAHKVSVTSDIRFRQRCGWMPQSESDLEVVLGSRPLIEWTIRSLASALDNVDYREGTEVVRLRESDGQVTGVGARLLGSETEFELDADLVVDACGRRSKAPDWFEAMGYPRPSETTVNARWGYASVFVRVPSDWAPGFKALYCPPLGHGAPEGGAATRGCAMWVQEGEDRWIFTVQGSAGDYPPRSEQELREYIATIGVPEVDAALAKFTFLGPVQAWRDTTNRLRDYANLSRRPENFVVIGDAAAAFNPVYGQGMTVAALSASTLQTELATLSLGTGRELAGFAERFQKQLDATVNYCWSASTTQDYRVPGVEVLRDGVLQEVSVDEADFSDRLLAYVSTDPTLYRKFMETTQLVRSPEWLQSEAVVSAIKENWDELGKLILS